MSTIREEDEMSNHSSHKSQAGSEITQGMLDEIEEAEKTITNRQQPPVEDDTESIGTVREKLGLSRQSPPAPPPNPLVQSSKQHNTLLPFELFN